MDEIGVLICITLYFLPTLIASKHRNVMSIALLNLFLGWTFVGWVVAIIWAVSQEKKENITIYPSKNVSDEIQKLKSLYNDGTLTQEEFEEAKKHTLKK
jgi:hypothetical protein